MKRVIEEVLTGERALFNARDLEINDSIFEDGESPLKESQNIKLKDSSFQWKYPLWYSDDVTADNIVLTETARSGIWYTNNIIIENSLIQAPKSFRRSKGITLKNVKFPNAEETLWTCNNISLDNVSVSGNYFGKDSKNITAKNLTISGNYAFDGAENIEIENARIISKDAFWNCKNVVVKNSTIVGEYLGWNSKNVTFINCVIESEQGLCYMENLKMQSCKLLNSDLVFEYSTVDAEILSNIISVKNPISGVINANRIGEIIFDDEQIDCQETIITQKEQLKNAI